MPWLASPIAGLLITVVDCLRLLERFREETQQAKGTRNAGPFCGSWSRERLLGLDRPIRLNALNSNTDSGSISVGSTF